MRSLRRHDFAFLRTGPVRLSVTALVTITAAFSQMSSVSGTVKDQSGSIVGAAVVALTDDATKTKKTSVTSAVGGYEFTALRPGGYKVDVTAPGFAVYSKTITVAAAPMTLDIGLEIARTATHVAVEARLDPYNVVPSTPTQSIFGFDQKLEDIPRSISIADAETMLRYSVKTVNDIVAVSTGSFTGSYFGIPGSVFLRGDIGDNFFRGFRRVENRGNFQTPVAATDHIEVVKGPPSPIYGGGRVGGFLNFIPKSARSESAKWLEKATGKVSMTYGSYDEKRGSAEAGLPFKLGTHRAGVYAFFEADDSHSFYKGVASRNKLGQISFDLELSPKLRLVYGFQGFHNEGTQNIGWNRVTQELVDKQLYLSGTPLVNLSKNGYDIRSGDIAPGTLTSFAFQKNMSGPFFGNPATAQLYALNPATVKLVTLPLDHIMIDAGDFSRATTTTGYFDINYDVNANVHIKNQTFMDWMNHQKFSSYGFGAGYRPWTIENKSTVSFDMTSSKWLVVHSIGGLSYRKVTVSAGEERNDFQVVDRRDLSVGATSNDRFAGPYNSNGKIAYQYFQTGNYGDTGLFWLSDMIFFNKLSVTAGLRFDRYTPDFTGRDFGEPNTRATATQNATTYNASVSYRLPFHLTPYFTAATSRFLDLGQGNELDYSQVKNGTFIQTSNLYEGGVKTSLGQKLFASASIFRQKRAAYNNFTREADYYRTTGAEFEARSYLMRRLSLTAALTWQRPEQLNVPFLLGIPPNLLGIDPVKAYAGRFIGVANIFGLQAPLPVGGQPHVVFSPFATVNVTRQLGFTLGTSWVSSVKTGYISDVNLPSYALTRGSVFFQHGKHLVNLAMNNMFDKVYFQSQFLFWDVFIKPGALRTASLTYTLIF
ncbi:MAG: TonB-dependent receptor [Candidatus Solibacter usitatus]|nr:TonB-dependent receptor [Candidatus Solibacter usitatus]